MLTIVHDDIIYPSSHSLRSRPSRLLRGDLDRRHLAGAGHLHHALLAAHLRHRRRLSSLFLAPLLFDEPGVSVRPRVPVPDHHAKERHLVGLQAPPSPFAFRHRARRAFAAAPRFHLQPFGLDLRAEARRPRLGQSHRPHALSRTDVAAQIRAVLPAVAPCRPVLSPGGLVRPRRRLPVEHGARLSRAPSASTRSPM